MARYFDQVMETAGLYNTVGFIDDTRAFLSIPARHDVWRRASANWLASLVVRGLIDMERSHGNGARHGEWPGPADLQAVVITCRGDRRSPLPSRGRMIGLDLGTTNCKAVLLDADGHVRAKASESYKLLIPRPGWAEQDVRLMWERCDEGPGGGRRFRSGHLRTPRHPPGHQYLRRHAQPVSGRRRGRHADCQRDDVGRCPGDGRVSEPDRRCRRPCDLPAYGLPGPLDVPSSAPALVGTGRTGADAGRLPLGGTQRLDPARPDWRAGRPI